MVMVGRETFWTEVTGRPAIDPPTFTISGKLVSGRAIARPSGQSGIWAKLPAGRQIPGRGFAAEGAVCPVASIAGGHASKIADISQALFSTAPLPSSRRIDPPPAGELSNHQF
jgi:hypothetical protein